MIHHKHVERKWWTEEMNTAAYNTNRLPCAAHPEETPFQICFGHRPKVKGMRNFGDIRYAHIDKSSRKVLEKKSFPCMFLGYYDDIKVDRILNMDSKRVELTRSAQFQKRPNTKYIDVNFNHGNDVRTRHMDPDDDHDLPDTRTMVTPVEQSVEPMDVD
uniref:Putative polyprotein n=1 Tax=Albugo laibachii Nc14 TaxID=890382 RepID=F0X2M0_9STRA|nr:putative polyprotein [Albugo laibachii Nc14]|eukprot:CCA28134.1 putative polyprotein [Albugo laibachii Nc14]